MVMLKYRCQLCGRIHYGRIGLKAGYCTTCGPRGGLIADIGWDKMSGAMVKAIEDATKGFRELGKAIVEVTGNIR